MTDEEVWLTGYCAVLGGYVAAYGKEWDDPDLFDARASAREAGEAALTDFRRRFPEKTPYREMARRIGL